MARGIQPDRVRIRETRECLGWTQEQLATESELSTRVVAKVESGGTISRATLEKIARAFQGSGEVASAADLEFAPDQVLRALLKNPPRTKGATTWENRLAADAALCITGDEAWLPVAGTHNGTADLVAAWTGFFAMFESRANDLGQTGQIARTDSGAVAWGHRRLRDHPGGPPCLLLVRMRANDGLIIFLEVHFDEVGIHARLSRSRQVNARE